MDDFKKNEQYCKKLRELRRARGMTVDDLAGKMGEDAQKVGRVERGQRTLSLDYLLKVAKALETPVESLLGKNENSKATFDILNGVVLLVERHYPRFYDAKNLEKKALFISKIYESASQFPRDYQAAFLNALESLLEIAELDSSKNRNVKE